MELNHPSPKATGLQPVPLPLRYKSAFCFLHAHGRIRTFSKTFAKSYANPLHYMGAAGVEGFEPPRIIRFGVGRGFLYRLTPIVLLLTFLPNHPINKGFQILAALGALFPVG
jgi:hypothetical protein